MAAWACEEDMQQLHKINTGNENKNEAVKSEAGCERICWGMHRHKETKQCLATDYSLMPADEYSIPGLQGGRMKRGREREREGESGRIKRGWTHVRGISESVFGSVSKTEIKVDAWKKKTLLISSWIHHSVKLIIPPTYICMPAKDCRS